MLQLMSPRLLENGMVGVQRGADGQAFVSSSRLNVGSAKRRAFEEFAVGNTIESASSGHRQVIERNFCVQMIQQMKEDFLEAMLHGKSQVHLPLRNLALRLARRAK